MKGRQSNLNEFKPKTVTVHGSCKCGVHYQGSLNVSPLKLTLPNEAYENVATHFVIVCWVCGRLVNLVSVSKPSKKGR